MSIFRQFLAYLAAALAAVRGGFTGGLAYLNAAFEEAVEPVTAAWPAVRDRAAGAGAALVAGAGYGAIGAGRAVSTAGSVLDGVSELSRLRAPGPVTAGDVADAAVEADDAPRPWTSAQIGATVLHAAAEALRHGGPGELPRYADYVPPCVQDWLVGLSRHDLDAAIELPPEVLFRHAFADRAQDCSPLLPPPARVLEAAAPTLSEAECDAIMARARRFLAASRGEVAAMATRGPRPGQDPEWDDEPSSGPRPALH